MIILLHIIIAVLSVIQTTYLYKSPTSQQFKQTYFLVGATIASGTALIITEPAAMVQACTIGLFYIGAVALAVIAAKRKLAKELTK